MQQIIDAIQANQEKLVGLTRSMEQWYGATKRLSELAGRNEARLRKYPIWLRIIRYPRFNAIRCIIRDTRLAQHTTMMYSLDRARRVSRTKAKIRELEQILNGSNS